MKICLLTFFVLFSPLLWAQDDEELKNNYFMFYPIELLAGQPRAGVELELKPNVTFVFDLQCYFGEDPYYDFDKYFGYAIKTDLRFYTPANKSRNRVFMGPNLLVKRKNNAYYQTDNYYNSNVIALSFKYGKEYYLSYYTRFDIYCGIGIRYKSQMPNSFINSEDTKMLYDVIVPNILLGLTFKFR